MNRIVRKLLNYFQVNLFAVYLEQHQNSYRKGFCMTKGRINCGCVLICNLSIFCLPSEIQYKFSKSNEVTYEVKSLEMNKLKKAL